MASEKVHLFFPENDLALALDLANYTPPPAAVRLRRSGEALPLWYGAEDDSFISTGVNAEWLDKMRSLFGMGVGVYGYDASGCVAAPWGWSKASRKVYADRGFAPADLPDDARLERIRELSHRQSSVFIGERLAGALSFPLAPVARECRTYAQVEAFVDANGESVLKLPWSSSGRGLVRTDRSTLEGQRRMVEGMIRRQGSVMAEKFLEKSKDFAMLFTAEGGCCRYEGLSLFTTDRLGSYSGNELAAQDELGRRIGCPVLGELSDLLPGILHELIGDAYQGPLGVDMMVLADGSVAPAVELNLRMTMGHVSLRLYENYVAQGATGRFAVVPRQDYVPGGEAVVSHGRLCGGSLRLTPPGGDFVFDVTLDVPGA